MRERKFSDHSVHAGSLAVKTSSNAGGILIDIHIRGMRPNGKSLAKNIAVEARRLIAIRTLNNESLWKDNRNRKDLLREILMGVEIVPVDETRIFLQSDDLARLARFFETKDFPRQNFFQLDQKEITYLENFAFGNRDEQVGFIECWTRTGKSGRYIICENGGSAKGNGGGKGERTGYNNSDKDNSNNGGDQGGNGPNESVGPTYGGRPKPPKTPKGVNIDDNIKEAEKHRSDWKWFKDQVKNKGPWDYKQKGPEFQDAGNFNYGATGKAIGIPDRILLMGAGWAQEEAGTSKEEWNSWYGSPPYGDDPKDQEKIKEGIDYYNNTVRDLI